MICIIVERNNWAIEKYLEVCTSKERNGRA